MKVRLFIAIPIPDDIREEIINNTKLDGNFRITKKENLHITVLFLGDTDESRIPEISKQIEDAVKDYSPFEINVSQFGQFPPKGYPRIVYVTGNNPRLGKTPAEGSDKLIQLANNIRANLKKLGFYDDKPFTYHVTVARPRERSSSGSITLPELKNKLCYKVEKVVLYKSDLRPGGPVYTEVWSKELYV